MGLFDRHATLSMEMLLKLVAVFGPMIQSTIAARRGLGVDLNAEQRCNVLHIHFFGVLLNFFFFAH